MVGTTHCAGYAKAGGKLLRCSRCQSRAYCGTECQKQDWPRHKSGCKRQNYILKVDLHPCHITNPPITRTLSCPATSTFDQLSSALQIAFAWAGNFMYKFEFFNDSEALEEEEPLSSRPSPILPVDYNPIDSIYDVVGALQSQRDSYKTKLFAILDGPTTAGKTFQYVYDFSERWIHVVTCIGRAPSTDSFSCIDGQGHECAEDVGGWSGWLDLLDAYVQEHADPVLSMKRTRLRSWYQDTCRNGRERGLGGTYKLVWDKDAINTRLAHLLDSCHTRAPGQPAASILLVSLEKQFFFDQLFADVLERLRTKTRITEVCQVPDAMDELSGKRGKAYTAVVLTDAAVVRGTYAAFRTRVEEYARTGGRVILGLGLPCSAPPLELDRFFKEAFDLPWKTSHSH